VWDLAFDPSELFSLDAATIRTRLFTKTDALPENVSRLPIKTIHLNKSPVVINNLKTLSPERAAHWGVDMAAVERHAALCAAAPDMQRVWQAVFERPATAASDVDADLYGGFVGNNDRRLLNRLLSQSPEQLASATPNFEDARLEDLFFRYRARNFPATLNPVEMQHWQAIAPPGCMTARAARARSKPCSTKSTHWLKPPTNAAKRYLVNCMSTPKPLHPSR
jgi:Exodeoxyribonuclease I subunit C (EC 3.1.11.1)